MSTKKTKSKKKSKDTSKISLFINKHLEGVTQESLDKLFWIGVVSMLGLSTMLLITLEITLIIKFIL